MFFSFVSAFDYRLIPKHNSEEQQQEFFLAVGSVECQGSSEEVETITRYFSNILFSPTFQEKQRMRSEKDQFEEIQTSDS